MFNHQNTIMRRVVRAIGKHAMTFLLVEPVERFSFDESAYGDGHQ